MTNIKETISKIKTDTSGKWVSIEEVEKLAESIVKECVSVGYTAFLNDNSTVPVFPSVKIKEHFGVEE